MGTASSQLGDLVERHRDSISETSNIWRRDMSIGVRATFNRAVRGLVATGLCGCCSHVRESARRSLRFNELCFLDSTKYREAVQDIELEMPRAIGRRAV